MSFALNDASIASSLKYPSFQESNRAGAYQCVKTGHGGDGEKKNRKVRTCCTSSDRSLASRGITNILMIHRRRRSGRQSRSRASSQARSHKRVFRAFDVEDDSVYSLVSTYHQSLSAPPMLPSSPLMSLSSSPGSLTSPPVSPSSVMDAFSASDTTDDVHRYESIRTMLKSGLS
jgi:hypothetical protein